jgi:predicted 2-oxoglutarate/Fe(II)-dependent dioxygenase YbiX
MASPAAFDRLGVFARPGFLPAAECAALSRTMDVARWVPGTVSKVEHDETLDEAVRKVRCVDVGLTAATSLRDRLCAIQGELAAFFGETLVACDGPNFLAYDVGSFYTPHRDNGARYQERRVSAVLFLNSGEYTGGELTFHGLLSDGPWAHCPLPLDATAGLLVAFSSGVRHEVRPVRSGRRYTAAAWFTGRAAA